MLTQQETDVDRGKPWPASGTPLGKRQIAAMELWHFAHTTFSAVSTLPPLFVC